MSEPLIFMMGKFSAEFPTDRSYCKNHMWAERRSDGRYRFGFTAYAVRLLQDVYFLDWSVDEGSTVREKQLLGNIESKKAESELYAPIPGVLAEFNANLLADPSAINVDKYAQGWLFEIQPGSEPALLSPEEYLAHLASVWETTQRLIKGQLND